MRFGGKAWAYRQEAAGKFVRREVALDWPTDAGWFVTSFFAANDQVVVSGGQMLLSEELKSQIQVGEEGE